MLADIPKQNGSKKVDVTINPIADAKARVKRDLEAKDKARFEQEKRVFMEINEQGTSKPREEEIPEQKRKLPTRKVRLPKTTPTKSTKPVSKPTKSSSHQSSKPTTVVTPVVSTTDDTSVVSAVVNPTTTTSTTNTAPTSITTSPKTNPLPPTSPAIN
ncbi:hypothetical protein Hanom_Chr06g00525261 [Helianthus anomalus]